MVKYSPDKREKTVVIGVKKEIENKPMTSGTAQNRKSVSVMSHRREEETSDGASATTWARQHPLPHELMTESELIDFLRIPEVSKAGNYHNVIDNLKRFHDLPRIHIGGQPLYPREAVQQWIRNKTTSEK